MAENSNSKQPAALICSLLQQQDVPRVVDVINDAFMVDAFFKHPQYHMRTSIDELTRSVIEQQGDLIAHVVGRLPDISDPPSPLQIDSNLPSPSTTTPSANDDSIVASCALSFGADLVFSLQPPSVEEKSLTISITNLRQYSNDIEYIRSLLNTQLHDHNMTLSDISSVTICLFIQVFEVSVHSSCQGKGLGKILVSQTEQIGLNVISKYQANLEQTMQNLLPSHVPVGVQFVSKLEVLTAVRPDLEPWYAKQGYKVQFLQDFSHKHICLPSYDFQSTMMQKPL